jgi:hypothetical protein
MQDSWLVKTPKDKTHKPAFDARAPQSLAVPNSG